MRRIGRQRRLRGPAALGLAAMVAIAVGGSLAVTQASAATSTPAARAGGSGGLSVSKQYFGSTIEPYTGKETAVYRYTLRNAKGMSVQVLTFGGIIQDINVPDKHGHVADVTLGFKTLQDYVTEDSPPVTANGGPYFGETIGRYGNRIAKGTFTLDQPGVGPVKYTLPINNGVNSLHGGLVGFGDHVWASQPVSGHGSVGVQLTLVSPNGDSSGAAGSPGCPNGCTGYPATIKVIVTFTLNNADQLAIHYRTTDQSKNLNTVINLTNHSYFNLAGEGSGPVLGHEVQVAAEDYVPADATLTLSDRREPVAGRGADFTHPRRLQDALPGLAGAHGDLYLLRRAGESPPAGPTFAARVSEERSGRVLEVRTDDACLQFYTGVGLDGTLVGKSGRAYGPHAGLCLECEGYPNGSAVGGFGEIMVRPGSPLLRRTIYAFSAA